LLSARNFYLGLIVVALAVGAFSLLIPSTPSYDPWSWIVWGREIVHVNLQTTGGPTWKPLPVIFTTVFALFGKAEPDLWLVVARAGAFAAVVMVFRLSVRLTRQIGTYFARPASDDGTDPGRADLLLAWLPALLAGVVAAIGLALSGGYISSNALGYSEGLATAAILIALERHMDGKPRQAFAVGFLAALDRPEIWLFWGPYGLWLYWKDPDARKLVAGLFVLIPILWFAPEYWGSGHFLRGASRAQHVRSNSLALAKCPFCSELTKAAWPTVLLRIKLAAAVLAVVVGFVLARGWRRSRRDVLKDPRVRAQSVALAAGALGVVWFVVVAVMTQAGFSGNNRYLVIGSALVEICGAVAWGWAASEIGSLVARRLRRGREAAASAGTALAGGLVGVAIAGIAFLALPNWIGRNLIDIPRTHHSIVYQAKLRADVTKLVAKYGGAKKLLRCGSVMTEGFQVPLVAWTLGTHTLTILGPPAAGTKPGAAPNVVLQTRAQTNATLLPILHAWPNVHYTYVGSMRTFRLFEHCKSAA
jgi:glucose uptake protein GlcU